jgi:small subunit ribosomal protein S8
MVNDPIADMLTRIRNAAMARHTQVLMPSSKLKVQIAKILREEGFIQDFDQRKPVLSGLERASRPGRRIYNGRKNLQWVKSGMGIAILTTSKGLMTDRKARRMNIGGEVLCYVW